MIPAEIRRRLCIRPGDEVEVREVNGIVEVLPFSEDPIETLCGILAGGDSLTAALLEDRRLELEAEEAGLTPPRA